METRATGGLTISRYGPAPSWGLHGIDVELVIGNLVDLVGQQAKAFLGGRGENSPPR